MKARRWDEIMRIASTQVVVTAKVETVDGQVIPQFGIRIVHKKVGSLTNILYLYG